MKSYLERTTEIFKKHDFIVQKVEYYNAHGGNRVDLFGFIDVLALHPSEGAIGVQVCGKDWSEHIKKMTGPRKEELIHWLLAGNRCILIGWRRLKSRGNKYTPRVKEFTLEADFPEITPEIIRTLQAGPRTILKTLTDLSEK